MTSLNQNKWVIGSDYLMYVIVLMTANSYPIKWVLKRINMPLLELTLHWYRFGSRPHFTLFYLLLFSHIYLASYLIYKFINFYIKENNTHFRKRGSLMPKYLPTPFERKLLIIHLCTYFTKICIFPSLLKLHLNTLPERSQ